MQFYKFNQRNIVCFSKGELLPFFKDLFRERITKYVIQHGLSLDELLSNHEMTNPIINELSKEVTESKEEQEIFLGYFSLLDYYEMPSEICFELKSDYQIDRSEIRIIDDLKLAIEQNTINDCIVKNSQGLRQFQLKRYRGALSTEELSNFLISQIAKYGNNLGDVNLFVVLQPKEFGTFHIDFPDVAAELKKQNYQFTAEILVVYNENNEFDVISRLYPDPASMKKPMKYPSDKY